MPAVFHEIVYGPVVIGIAAAVVAFQIVVFVMAARRRGRPPLRMMVHGTAATAIAGMVVAIGVSAHAARGMAMRAIRAEGNPLGDAVGLLTGLVGEVNVIAFA